VRSCLRATRKTGVQLADAKYNVHIGMPQRNTSTPSSSGVKQGALSTWLSSSEDREPERVSTVQPGSREAGYPGGNRWQGDGDARGAQRAPRRRELTGLVADAGVVGKASESRDELRRERQPARGEGRSLYFAQHPDFMGRPRALGRAASSVAPRRENGNL